VGVVDAQMPRSSSRTGAGAGGCGRGVGRDSRNPVIGDAVLVRPATSARPVSFWAPKQFGAKFPLVTTRQRVEDIEMVFHIGDEVRHGTRIGTVTDVGTVLLHVRTTDGTSRAVCPWDIVKVSASKDRTTSSFHRTE
jgi:hypothetical protein